MSSVRLGMLIAPKWKKKGLNGANPMSVMESDLVLTTDEAIEYLRISKPTFLKYIRVGRIRAIKAGKGWRVLQSELYKFLKGKTDNGDISLDPTA
jgi:excisionase family DNA binding protein